MNELKVKANAQIKKAVDYLKESKDMFGYMDLKLHDVSWYMYKDMENDFPLCYKEAEENNDDYFSWFCEEEFDSFMEWCTESNIDFDKMCHQLGRTSSFYLHGWSKDATDMFFDILNEIANYWYESYLTVCEDGSICVIYEDDEMSEDAIEYFANDFYDEFIERIEPIKTVYNYITDFKSQQVEIFKEWLDYYEDSLKEDARREAEKEANDLNTATEIVNRYKISSDDIKSLKMTIYTL